MSKQETFILALDQGTTSSRAILFDQKGSIRSVAQKDFNQYFPKPGWVEHNPDEIWSSQASVAAEVVAQSGYSGKSIHSIGITNQRETTLVWDRSTGRPIYNAIVWQDRRTATYCNQLKNQGHEDLIRQKTGLVIDAYFSASKIHWILNAVDGAMAKAKRGELMFGTVDTWLMYKLSNQKVHLTDVTNASRTMLFNIHTLEWDQDLLDMFEIPLSMMPEVKSCSETFCELASDIFSTKVPITGVAGDQQAALFGQLCLDEGMIKTTYGTGCFMVLNTGNKAVISDNKLLTTIGWKIGNELKYALEGSVFVGGAAIQWLRDQVNMIESSEESESLAKKVKDNGGVYFVPAMTGLGAPYWDQDARGAIFGITRGTNSAHIVRAALEGIAFQVNDVLTAMEADYGEKTKEMRVDGGAAANDLLVQFQADVSRIPLLRPQILETTALGAAYLSGLASGYWPDIESIKAQWKVDRAFNPVKDEGEVAESIRYWRKAVNRSLNWLD